MGELEDLVKHGKEFLAQLELEKSFIKLGLLARQARIAARGTGGVRNMGHTKPVGEDDLASAIKRLRPDFTEDQVELFLRGR